MTVESKSPLAEFVGKLERRSALPSDVRAAFLSLPHSILGVEAGDVVCQEGSNSSRSFFVSSGFVSRQKKVEGIDQIIGVGIAGDAVDLQSLWFHQNDHSLVAHERSCLIGVEHREIIALCDQQPAINRALWHDTLVDAAIFREWALNIGHRSAKLRIGHLMLELATRLRSHGLISGNIFNLPLTQNELASALGLSLVHTNKSLKALQREHLLYHSGRQFQITDGPTLQRLTGFDPDYLHLDRPPKFDV